MIFESVTLNLYLTIFLILASTTTATVKPANIRHGNYSIVKGFFKHTDNPSTHHDYKDNLGLNDNTTWPELKTKLDNLNSESPANTTYKLIYLGRHAEGWHNLAQEFYGDAYGCYYALRNGNGTVYWGPDAYLTPRGIEQASNNSVLLKSLIQNEFPLPQAFYVSPFSRCADTMNHTWYDLVFRQGYATPIFKESLRESIDCGTAEHRRTKTYLQQRYPTYDFEQGFSEYDLLYTNPLYNQTGKVETQNGMYWRAKSFSDDLFSSEDATIVSVTAHGVIDTVMTKVVGIQIGLPFDEAGIVPLLVKCVVDLNDKGDQPIDTSIAPEPFWSDFHTCDSQVSYTTLPSSVATATLTGSVGKAVSTASDRYDVTTSSSKTSQTSSANASLGPQVPKNLTYYLSLLLFLFNW
ncbi:unnamed protein product [Ambrosiozyma monospora]|uniref:Unnamed protein product n=1 Tax=Ambrosiozyma monospora TaxID=43982 RepID=A0A9W6Z232_AMBMO|nr:unnamed protein product [Ambrosiozyma monospora]